MGQSQSPGCRGELPEHPQASTQRTGLRDQHRLEAAPNQPPGDATHESRPLDQTPGGSRGQAEGVPRHSRGAVPACSKLPGQIPAGPQAQGLRRAPASPAPRSRQHTGKGPGPDPALPFLCSPRSSPGTEHQSQGTHPPALPKSEGDIESPAPHFLGAAAGTLHPPSPPQQDRVPSQGNQRGNQGGKRSVMG